jgi:hypothetical protein
MVTIEIVFKQEQTMMKRHKLPCKPYVKKYVAADMENGVLKIKNRVVRTVQDKTAVVNYFKTVDTSTCSIIVEMKSSSLYVLYALHSTLAREFRDKLFSVMAYAVRKGIPAREAARDFLEMYEIETDEYDLDSAYRTWQRRKERYLNPTAPVIKTNQKEVSTLQLRGQLALFS